MAKAAGKSKAKAKKPSKSRSPSQDEVGVPPIMNPDLQRLREAWEAQKPKTRLQKFFRWLHIRKLRYDNMMGIPCFDTSEVIMLHCTILLVTAFIVFGLYKNWMMLMSRL